MQQRTSEGGSDAEQQPAIPDAVGRDLPLPVVQRAALLELALDRRVGLIDQRLFAGADDAIRQHERPVMPADTRHAAHALVRLRHLHIVRDLRAGDLRHAELHAHIEQHAAQLRTIAGKQSGRHRPPFQDAVAVREFEQVAPFAVHLVSRLRDHVDTRADPMRRQRITLIVEAVKPHALVVDDEPRLAVLRAGRFRALGGLRGDWSGLGLARIRRADRRERSAHGGGHRIRADVRSQVVEVGPVRRAIRTEVGHRDDAGDGLGRRAGLRHARIALRRVVVVRAHDDAGVRILAAQRRRDRVQVACVERDGGRIARRGRERRARGVTLANQQRGRRGR
ncbi:hypothetical protein BCCR75596_02414 [Burkholderia sola]|nr:hypothetical protein BCCR75596_02414 [Burkholderia cenocepacia]